MCLGCCCNPEENSADDPKSKLLSPETPAKTQNENEKLNTKKKVKKVKKSDKSHKNPVPPDDYESCVVPDEGTRAAFEIPATEGDKFPPEWNTRAARFAANTFVSLGLAKRDETLKKTVDKSSELNENTRRYRSLSKKLREKQEGKLKSSKLPW